MSDEARRLWQAFRARVYESALRQGIDADDLVSSFEEHLIEHSDTPVDKAAMEAMIAEFGEALSDTETESAPLLTHQPPWVAPVVSLALFLISLLSFAWIGPWLAPVSWVASRSLYAGNRAYGMATLMPAAFYSIVVLVLLALAGAFLPMAWISNLWALPNPGLMLGFAGLLGLLCSAILRLLAHGHSWTRRALFPVAPYIETLPLHGFLRILQALSALLLLAAIIVVILHAPAH